MARTPNRTGMGDSYKKGGKKKKKITYMQDGGKASDYTLENVRKEIPKKEEERRESWNTGAGRLGPAWWKEGSESPRPIYEPTTKTFFPRLQNLGHEIMKTFKGEGHSMTFPDRPRFEDGGSMYKHGGERSTRNQGNQSLMGGNVEQHD